MSYTIEKMFNGDYAVTIKPDENYRYISVQSPRTGVFFIEIDKHNMGRIITCNEVDTQQHSMSTFSTYPDNIVTQITDKTIIILPSKSNWLLEQN